MSEPDSRSSEQENNVFYAEEAPSGYTGETDRTSGEYHYKSGYTQKIYTDAAFFPESEAANTPHYYRPNMKPRTKKRKKLKWPKAASAVTLCLVCAIAGGVCGAGLMSSRFSTQLNSLQEQVDNLPVLAISEPTVTPFAATSMASADSNLLSDIYSRACKQTVGITTDITYMNIFGMTSSSAVSGTGFIVTEDGYIVTNYHVVESASRGNNVIKVMLHEGNTYEAVLVGYEDTNDIAVLKIDASGLNPVHLGNSDEIKVGDEAFAVGNPLGELSFSMTFGRISALDRLISTDDSGEPINMFQLDAAVNSGNSGGPVYDSTGSVIGVVTAKYANSGTEGLGFAIPINDVAVIANDIITKGYVTGKAYLGVVIDERYTAMYSRYYNMPLGAYVYQVFQGTCAEQIGIRGGDIIIGIGQQRIQNITDLKHAMRQYHSGDTAEIYLYRDGAEQCLSVTFDEVQTSGGHGV